ncbi:MAG TPA: DUF6152 family protein [Vicinamibacterales bacterium]|nr:DUF6152 family protein [Vicinamibacterales bacterium]
MTNTLASVLAAVGLLSATAVVEAHHSFSAQYDGTKPVVLRGTINRMLWSNPHGHMYLDVKKADGTVVTWELETASPAGLFRRGWRKEDLPVGAEVIVRGFLARDGTATANAGTVTLASTGKELFAGSPDDGSPQPPGGAK